MGILGSLKKFAQLMAEEPAAAINQVVGNKPSVILVDLVRAKIMMNLDSVDYKEYRHDNEKNGFITSASFSWKADGILVTASRSYGHSINVRNGQVFARPENNKWSIEPTIKVGSEKLTLTPKEQFKLWETMTEAGRLKFIRDKETEEFRRQQAAVNAIADICERETDNVAEAKRIAERAILQLQAPRHMQEPTLEERILGPSVEPLEDKKKA